jgi:hypothetical protein
MDMESNKDVRFDVREALPVPLLGVADPQHDDPQPRRLRATCPTWVTSPYDGVFTDQAVAYYEERA